MKTYTKPEIIAKIDRELPIIIVYNHLAMNPKLIHPNAIKNEHILNGDVILEPFDLDDIDLEKDKAVKTVCFFHDTEKDNSTNFVLPVPPEKQNDKGYGNFFNCFSCQYARKPLGVINFYMVMRFGIPPKLLTAFKEMEKDVKSAYWKSVEELAALMGISYDNSKHDLTDEERLELRIQLIHKRSAQHYHQFLKSGEPFAKRSLAYLFKERGFTHLGNSFYKTIDELMIGCAPEPEGEHKVSKYFTTWLYDKLRKDFTDEELLASKVVIYNETYKRIVDKHKNGIILPYTNQGKVYNLYCRQFTKDKDWRHMKLQMGINFPMGFDVARNYPVIIPVEGEMDFITMRALGFKNVVLYGGTNGASDNSVLVHRFQLQYLKTEGECCRTLLLCMDGDKKGQEAMEKRGADLLKEDIDVRAARLSYTIPETGEVFTDDPNKFLQKFGVKTKEILTKILDEALSYNAFRLVRLADKEKPQTPTEQLGFLRRNRSLLQDIPMDEKLFIALEIADTFRINPSWLLSVWKITEAPPIETKVLPKEAMEMRWLLVFDDKDLANVCKSRLPHSVFFEDAESFVQAAKTHPNLQAIVLHEGLSNEYKDIVYHAFPSLQFRKFIGSNAEAVRNMQEYEFMSLFRKGTNPYVNEVS